MALVIVRPTAQHAASKVLTATQQAGLTVQEPEPAAANSGILRLTAAGGPLEPVSLDVAMQTGGAPTGYSPTDPGAAFRWRQAGGAATSWRGWTDTQVLTGVAHPIGYTGTQGPPSTPRELADGYLGLFCATDALTLRFYRIAEDWSSSSVAVSSSTAYGASTARRADFVVMPDGSLIAYAYAAGGTITSWRSADNGLTWASHGSSTGHNATLDVLCVEQVGGEVVAVLGDSAGAAASSVLLSLDGGADFGETETAGAAIDPRTAVVDGVVVVVARQAVNLWAWRVSPGGGLVSVSTTQAGTNSQGCVIARDDGVLLAWGWEATAAGALNCDLAVSLDGGLTWTDPGAAPFSAEVVGYATNGLSDFAGTFWRGKAVIVCRSDSSTGSDNGLHFLCFGEWSSYPHGAFGLAVGNYSVGYLPLDYPNQMGFTRADTGAGATITNQPFLRMVGTGGNGTRYYRLQGAGLWNYAMGERVVIRCRLRVVSGGSLTSNDVVLDASIDDGANTQGVRLRFTTTGARCLATTGAQIGSDLALDFTKWTDVLVELWTDNPAGVGVVNIRTMQDADEGLAAAWITNGAVAEQVGVAVGEVAWRTVNAATADLATLLSYELSLTTVTTSPTGLIGRPLSAVYPVWVTGGVRLGAYGTGGVTGDTYTLATRYTYGADNVWTELRPSRRAQSTDDLNTWAITFDAGAADLFHGNYVAVFGTNVLTARWQLNTADSWGAPAVSVALSSSLATFTISAAGAGYLFSTGTPNWRQGQWKSNGDSRRFFIRVPSGVSYEITDNDESRVYVAGVDLTGAVGSCTIYGDRMAALLPSFAQYRFARFVVDTVQDTADGAYRCGTPIFDRGWEPAQLYDFGFVERVEPNVVTTDAESGASVSFRRGPALDTLSIQWPPLDRLRNDVEERLRDLYRSINGSLTPVVIWRDTADLSTLSLVQVREVYQATNVLGELDNAVTRVDQLVLREVW